jgi:exonuclease SbcD
MNPKDPAHIRVLHTADWHLGREFLGADLTATHQHFFDWLATRIGELEVDVVIMAGDIFDRALPPAASVESLNERLADLSELTEVILVAGNHDSMKRLSYGPLLKPGIHLRSGTAEIGRPVEVRRGEVELLVYPVPYLDPGLVARELDVEETRHEPVLRAAFDRCREDLSGREGPLRSIAVAHAFVRGSTESESERTISVGDADQVPASTFDGFDYVALGHLHRPQTVADSIRYSGSPIPLSYSEVGPGLSKSVTLIDLPASGPLLVQEVEVEQLNRFDRISGTLDELLADGAYEDKTTHWLEITLTDERRPDQPMNRLRSRFEHIMSLRFEAPISSGDEKEAEELTGLAKADPVELAARFLEHVRGEGNGPDDDERALLEEAVKSRAAEETAG